MSIDFTTTLDDETIDGAKVIEVFHEFGKKEYKQHKELPFYCFREDMHECFIDELINCEIVFDEFGEVAEVNIPSDVFLEFIDKESRKEDTEKEV